jgi:hypothetical protein
MRLLTYCLAMFLFMPTVCGQSSENHWSTQERQLRYRPDGTDFVIVNGTKRFNRALYGTETSFRTEAGDLPEFAIYKQGFGGNIQLGIVNGDKSIWLPQAQFIEARYKGAEMVYHIRDGLLGDATLTVTVLALSNAEGFVIKVHADRLLADVALCWTYGGATGKRFSREGDLNTDPESVFYLKPEHCQGNLFTMRNGGFVYQYGSGQQLLADELYPVGKPDTLRFKNLKGIKRLVAGRFPDGAQLLEADAKAMASPLSVMASEKSETPVLAGQIKGIDKNGHYLLWQVPESVAQLKQAPSAGAIAFDKAAEARRILVDRVKIETPDAYINTLGPTIAAAADGIWETPTYLHGAIGWRMRLPGWRGPYTADPLGWHDRAMTHFQAYAESQITSPASGPSVPDPAKNLARQQPKLGTALYTEGYICRNPNGDIRPHHYDMNLVFIDGLLRHFRWTGDVAFIREMWPVLTRHLAWEKRNFDGDNDGLYDAYCCIWASDALEYSGGGVAHSSAYNYLANKMAARLAEVLGENPKPYQLEAEKILNAIQTRLWLPGKGWFAEYVDWTGLERTHDASALWTIYHVLDSEVADPFQAWQATRYAETSLPKLPVKGKGLDDGGYYVHSTTTWQPYDWSINNVVMAENLHMALSHWQAGRNNEAFHLWKSTLLDAMYLGGSPGNFVQLSFLDAARGEMYRDFADEVGMTARSLVEGLFGILPNAIDGKLFIKPGFPSSWDKASIKTPYIDYQYQYQPKTLRETYRFKMSFAKPLSLTMALPAKADRIKWVKVNGKKVGWQVDAQAVGQPFVLVECGVSVNTSIEVQWDGNAIETTPVERRAVAGRKLNWVLKNARFVQLNDPQQVLVKTNFSGGVLVGEAAGEKGARTTFAKVQQGDMVWWMPLTMHLTDGFVIEAPREQPSTGIRLRLHNNGYEVLNGQLMVNHRDVNMPLSAPAYSHSPWIEVGAQHLLPGTNLVQWVVNGEVMASANVINWQLPAIGVRWHSAW